MSRSFAFVAALVVSFGCGSASFAQENPAAGGGLGGGGPRGGAAGGGGLGGLRAAGRTIEEAAVARGLRTSADAELEAALRKPAKFDFAETPLSDVVDFVASQFDINVQIDRKSLTDAAVDPSAPVTISLRKPIALESALHLILGEFDLTFTIQDDVLKILNKGQADEILTTKVYAVSDLLDRGPRRGGVDALVNSITSNIQPDAWNYNGGPGSITRIEGTLVVSQKRDVHEEIHRLLAQLRAELPQKAAGQNAGDTTPRMSTATYQLGGASGEQTAVAIKKLLMPASWQGEGGEGQIFVIARNTADGQSADLLLVRQTDEVQGKIEDLLAEFTKLVPGSSKGSGGMGLGGGGVMGGGMGGGFFTPAQAAPDGE